MQGLSLVVASGGHSSSRCVGLSLSRPLLLRSRLQTRRLSSCGSRAQPLRGMWDLPRPGLEPVSPALAGRFSTTAPPGKPSLSILRWIRIPSDLWGPPRVHHYILLCPPRCPGRPTASQRRLQRHLNALRNTGVSVFLPHQHARLSPADHPEGRQG